MSSALQRLLRSLGLDRHSQEAAEELAREARSGRTSAGGAGGFGLGPDDGVHVAPVPVTALSEVTVSYGGLLAKSGAEKVYLHCGEGPGPWTNVRDVPMQRGPAGDWFVRVEVGESPTFEFCFHDGEGNWDNNNGADWSVTVHSGGRPG